MLVGPSAAGLLDIRPTPLTTGMPGVEVQAQLLENVLAGSYLVRPSYVLGLELVVVALGGLLLIVLVPEVSARWTLGLHAVASAGLFGGSLYLFDARDVLLDWSFPVFAGTAIYLLLIYLKYSRTEKQRKLVAAQFSQYLSPVLVQQLQREPERLKLGGEIKTITMMFCDVRDFTSISERLRDDPQALTAVVNRFLNTMTEAVLAEGGTIDKYVGDSLIAFWNAPVDVADHAARACRAALAMAKALQRLNDEQKAQAAAASAGAAAAPLLLAMGVGINTGECLVGNLGSTHRFNYSALGDAVNLSSRIESLSKHYGIPIIISESTRRLVPDFAALELDAVAVVGKTEAVKIYGILGPRPKPAPTPSASSRKRMTASSPPIAASAGTRSSACSTTAPRSTAASPSSTAATAAASPISSRSRRARTGTGCIGPRRSRGMASASPAETKQADRVVPEHAQPIRRIRQPARGNRQQFAIARRIGDRQEGPVRAPDAAIDTEGFQQCRRETVELVIGAGPRHEPEGGGELDGRKAGPTQLEHAAKAGRIDAGGDVADAEVIDEHFDLAAAQDRGEFRPLLVLREDLREPPRVLVAGRAVRRRRPWRAPDGRR